MIGKLGITVLSEDTAGGRGLLAEHGVAFWVKADSRCILFDTGQGMVISHNAEALGIDLSTADDVVISHGHYDHVGGLPDVLERLQKANLYVHPAAFEAKFAKAADGAGQPAGSPITDADAIRSRVADVVLTTGPTQVTDGVWVTGEIPRRSGFEDTGGPFYLDEGCTVPDPLVDDQALYVESREGVVVLLGCAHAGLVNTLDYVAELAGCDRIHAVLGGMHLLNASEERIAASLKSLERYDVQHIGAAHCTGLRAVVALVNSRPDRFVRLAAGSGVQIG